MTCIVGIVDKGKVYMGGDSAGISGSDLTIREDKKIFKNGDFLFGFTSSFRMGQLIEYKFIPPKISELSIDRYMVTEFIDALRICLKDGGYAKKKDEIEEGGEFLVGYRGRLFKICSDYQVAKTVLSFDACGCGASYALGALYIMTQMSISPENKIEKALLTAQQFSCGVREPFHIKVLE